MNRWSFSFRHRCLTVSQVRYAGNGCQVSRYHRYLARISYTRVIGIQRVGPDW